MFFLNELNISQTESLHLFEINKLRTVGLF